MVTKLTPLRAGHSVPTTKKHRPANLPFVSKNTSSLLPINTDNNFYKFIAFLLMLMGGCNNPQFTKEGKEPNKKSSHLEKNIFDGHLLITLDQFDELDRPGKSLNAQKLLSKRLTSEMLPVLNKILSEGPDEVIIAEYTNPGKFHGEDFGRSLRLILRKEFRGLNTSTILFLDYNEKTKRLEFPQDFFFNDSRKIIPDAMRMLIEYDVQPTSKELKGHKREYYVDHLNSGFFGTTISAQIDDKTSRVNDFHIYPTRDNNGNEPVGKNGKNIGVVSMLGCIGCHEKRKGFGSTGTSFEEMQRNVHLQENQDIAISHFLESTGKNKHFSSPEEKLKILHKLRTMLQNPKENLHNILPPGYLESLKDKQRILEHPSSVLSRYDSISRHTQPFLSVKR